MTDTKFWASCQGQLDKGNVLVGLYKSTDISSYQKKKYKLQSSQEAKFKYLQNQ